LAKPQALIECALLEQQLDLENSRIAPELYLVNSSLQQGATLLNSHFTRSLFFSSSTFAGQLFADRILVGGTLALRDGAIFIDISLVSANIGSDVDLSNSSLTGPLNAEDISINSNPLMNGAVFFEDVILDRASTGGDIAASTSTFEKTFSANNISIGGSLFLTNESIFNDVSILGASINRDFNAIGSTLYGRLSADRISIGGTALLREETIFNDVDLLGVSIGGALQLSGSQFNGIFGATGTTIGEEFQLSQAGISDAQWGSASRLILRNVSAGALQANLSAWPQHGGQDNYTDITGFQYDRLGGLSANTMHTKVDEPANKLIRWLNASTAHGGYDPQPYLQLAQTLSTAGQDAKAGAVRYARYLHRDGVVDAPMWKKQILRRVERWIVGYGVYPFRALIWFGGLVAIGFLVSFGSTASGLKGLSRRFLFSLENALALIEPNPLYREYFHGRVWVEFFFSFQKVAGFVLATLLVGALTLLAG
jgi:hypothetical protein